MRRLAVIVVVLAACGEPAARPPAQAPSAPPPAACGPGRIAFERDATGFPVPAGRLGIGIRGGGVVDYPVERVFAETKEAALDAGWGVEERATIRGEGHSVWGRNYGIRVLVFFHPMGPCRTAVTVLPWNM